jgi:CMP-N-acetylneuraminic acid synthetase
MDGCTRGEYRQVVAYGGPGVNPEIFGLVVARGGSKGIPGKNVRLMAGKPMIYWTIQAALKAKGLTRVFVSTDDHEIADICSHYGAEIPFLRPPALSTDTSTSVEVVVHFLNWLEQNQPCVPPFIMLLQPTSPLRTSVDIDAAIELQQEKDSAAVVSVVRSTHPPHWLKTISSEGFLQSWMNGDMPTQRQQVSHLYELNGAIYLVNTEVFLRLQTFTPDRTAPYIMPPERSLDIDTFWDFTLADLVLRKMDDQDEN